MTTNSSPESLGTKAERVVEHIVIGTGKFALGFAGDLFCRVGGLETTFITRNDFCKTSKESVVRDMKLSKDRSYTLHYSDGSTANVSGFELVYADYLKPSVDLVEMFCAQGLSLISIAVPEGALSEVATLLVTCLRERHKRFPDKALPLILTFINAERNGSKLKLMMLSQCLNEELEISLNDSCPDCVIDRICSEIDITVDRGVIVTAEKYALLAIESQNCNITLQSLSQAWSNEFRRPVLKSVVSLDVWEKLKYWGLNGLHLFLGSAANTPLYSGPRHTSPVKISDVLGHHRIRSLVDGYAAEVSLAIRSQAPDKITRSDARGFLVDTIRRIEEADDTDARLLHSLKLDTESIISILRKYGYADDDPKILNALAAELRSHTLGIFLEKVEVRMLDCAFVLAGEDEVHPLNLLMGSLCILKALAVETRK